MEKFHIHNDDVKIVKNDTKNNNKKSQFAFKKREVNRKTKIVNDENVTKYNKNKPLPKRLKPADTARQPLASVCVESGYVKATNSLNLKEDVIKKKCSPVPLPEKFITSNTSNENNISDKENQNNNKFLVSSNEGNILKCKNIYENIGILFADEYRHNIIKYLQEIEVRYLPKKNYMLHQPDITYKMRSILIDWLVAVAEEYKLTEITLYLAVSYLDRFLSSMSVVKHKFQLVGTAAMMIAAKVEEIYPPETSEYVYLTGDAYTANQLLRMEKALLKVLRFDVTTPTVCSFISEFCNLHNFNPTVMYLAMYLCELSLVQGDVHLAHLPSEMAAAAVALARYTLYEPEPWPKELQNTSGYTLKHLSPVIQQQQETFKESPVTPQQAVNQKYIKDKYDRVAKMKPRLLKLDELYET